MTVGRTSLAKNALSMARAWEEKRPVTDSTITSPPCRSATSHEGYPPHPTTFNSILYSHPPYSRTDRCDGM